MPHTLLPEQYRNMVAAYVFNARFLLEEGQALQAFIFIGTLTGTLSGSTEQHAVPVDTSSRQGKEMSADHARKVALLCQADYVLHLTESWSLNATDSKKIDAILEKYGSISAYPGRISIVAFVLEADEGVFVGTAPIKALGRSKSKRTISEPVFVKGDYAQGTLSNILPRPATVNLH